MGPTVSGTYFTRARIGGKRIRRSLQTSTPWVAVLRLNDLLKEHGALSEAKPTALPGPMTFVEADDEMMRRVDADLSLEPSAKAYRRRCLERLLRSWPDLATADVRKITGIRFAWSQCAAVERIPGKVSGAWVLRGTLVPVRALFENLEGGAR